MASAIGSRGLAGEFPFLDTIDAAALASILQRNAPFLESDEGLQLLGKGYYSFVFATANGWIVRVARTDDAAERHELEISLLPLVAPTLPLALPQPVRALEPCEVAPFGAVAYRRLPGDLMTEADASSPAGAAIATDLGTALAALHAIDPALLLGGGMPTASAHHLAMLRRETRPIRERLTAAEWERVNSWWDELFASRLLNSGALAPAHGDPWWENLTIENGRLAGILDWEFLSLSDPANDVGVTLQMGEGVLPQRAGGVPFRLDPGRPDARTTRPRPVRLADVLRHRLRHPPQRRSRVGRLAPQTPRRPDSAFPGLRTKDFVRPPSRSPASATACP